MNVGPQVGMDVMTPGVVLVEVALYFVVVVLALCGLVLFDVRVC